LKAVPIAHSRILLQQQTEVHIPNRKPVSKGSTRGPGSGIVGWEQPVLEKDAAAMGQLINPPVGKESSKSQSVDRDVGGDSGSLGRRQRSSITQKNDTLFTAKVSYQVVRKYPIPVLKNIPLTEFGNRI